VIRGGAPAPVVDRVALSRAMDHAATAASAAGTECGGDTVSRLVDLARVPAGDAFTAGSREAEAFALILAVIGGVS
jgi:hypothetical protein